MTYQDQIKSPKWQKKRLEVMELNRFKCEECQTEDTQLNVHHTYYRKGHKIWEYDNVELRCLCETCHTLTHEKQDKILSALGIMEIVASLEYKDQILGYIEGLSGITHEKEPSESYMQGFVDGMNNTDVSVRYAVLASINGVR